MNNFLLKYKEYIWLVLFPIILLLLIFFAINPLFQSIDERHDSIEQRKVDQEESIKKLKEFPEIEAQANKINEDTSKIQLVLKENQLIDFVQELERIADLTQNEITIQAEDVKEIKAKDKTEKENVVVNNLPDKNYVTFKINLKGTYNELLNFLHKTENMRYFSDVISFEIKKEPPMSFSNVPRNYNTFSSEAIIDVEEQEKSEFDENGQAIIYSILKVVAYLETKK